MTEKSFFFGGTSGDGALNPMSAEDFSDFMYYAMEWMYAYNGPSTLGRAEYGVEIEGTTVPLRGTVIPNNYSDLLPENDAGAHVQLKAGCAIVDGRLYSCDTTPAVEVTVATPGAGSNYYALGLEANYTAQTVRAISQGPVNSVNLLTKIFNSERKSASYFAVMAIVKVTSGGVITVYDCRRFTRMNGYQCLKVIGRQGANNNDWTFGGTNNYYPGSGVGFFPIFTKATEAAPRRIPQIYDPVFDTGYRSEPIGFCLACATDGKVNGQVFKATGSMELHTLIYAWDGTDLGTARLYALALGDYSLEQYAQYWSNQEPLTEEPQIAHHDYPV